MKLKFGNSIEVEFCMRYGNPSTESKLNALLEKGCSRIIFLPLYPHYAGATSATANDSLFRSLMKITWQPSVRTIEPYFQNPGYIKILAESVSAGYESAESKPEVLVTSYHGVPKRYLTQGDPYHCQCQKTTRLLKEKLGWSDDKIITTFQSKFGPEEWLQPYTVRKVAELAQNGVKNIAVIARGPLASGLLTGEINKDTKFAENDHRNYNIKGEAFDVGDTFSGVNFEKGLVAVEELKKVLPKNFSLSQLALKWILLQDGITVVIPGAINENQVNENANVSDMNDIHSLIPQIKNIYEKYIKEDVHNKWL